MTIQETKSVDRMIIQLGSGTRTDQKVHFGVDTYK